VLGNRDAQRLSIVSFTVGHCVRYLHHNYVVTLLNDLFGIQCRGGCSCAGPYGHRLLGIDLVKSREYERAILMGWEGIKPGWVRINFNYFISEAVFDFLLQAVHLVAEHGYKLLPHYAFCPESGLWYRRERPVAGGLGLRDLSYDSGRLEYRHSRLSEPESALASYLEQAWQIIEASVERFRAEEPRPDPPLPPDFERLRWFPLPGEVHAELRAGVTREGDGC